MVRRTITGLVKQGQRRLHFNHERASRRREILGAICKLPVEIVVYEKGAAALAIPDAAAWCWARGGTWRDAIRPVLSAVRTL